MKDISICEWGWLKCINGLSMFLNANEDSSTLTCKINPLNQKKRLEIM